MIRWNLLIHFPSKVPRTHLRSFQLSSTRSPSHTAQATTAISNIMYFSSRFLTYSRTLPSHAKVTVPPRRIVSPSERAQLRSARKKQADATLRQQKETVSQTSTTTTTSSQTHSDFNTTYNQSTLLVSSKKPWDSRIVYGFGVGIPTVLLSWAIYDDQSPPAKLARTVGITGLIEDIAEDFAKPTRPKLLPDWSQVRE